MSTDQQSPRSIAWGDLDAAPLLRGPYPDGTFELCESLVFSISLDPELPVNIVVPQGFRTDFASIPPIAQALGFQKFGRHTMAAVLHDYMFTRRLFRFSVANAIFNQALRASGVGPTRAWVMTAACQIFGRRYYRT
jgi:hypothetical protein